MITMSKDLISNYLCYYAHLQDKFIERGDMSLIDSFKWFTKANNREELINTNFINEMIRTYNFYVNFRMYSIEEDFFLNRDNNISNEDIDSFVHNCTFYEKPNNITNKRILEIVRNAFNHSLDSNLKVSMNGKNFELDIPDIRYPRQIARGGNPERLHMRFSIDYIKDLNNLISDKGRNVLYALFDIPKDFNIYSKHLYTELDKIKFIHYYFDRKLDPNVMQDFKDLNDKILKCDDKPEDINNQLRTLGDSINLPQVFDLTHDQKIAAIELIKKYVKTDDWNEKTIKHFMYNVLNHLTPVPSFKMQMLNYELWYLTLITGKENLSYKEALKTAIGSMDNENDKIKMNLRDKMDMCAYLLTEEFVVNTPYMMYIDSVITNLCDDEYIEIDGKKYETRKLRNSLVHARWYIGSNNRVYLFDGLPENKFDYNLELVGCIDMDKLIMWADNYLAQKNKEHGNVYTLRR